MGYLYMAYCLVLALLTMAACLRQRQSKWWPFFVLALPLAAPVFILKSKKKAGVIWLAAFFISFFAVLGVEFFLYTSNKENNKSSQLPPIVRQMILLNEAVKTSTIELYNASNKLDSLSMVQSRITDIRTTLDLIEKLRPMLKANQASIGRLTNYIESHGDYIRLQNLNWAFLINKFYTDPNVIQHNHSLVKYLAAFGDMLQYTHDNFENIMEIQSKSHMANYDAYYMRYRGIADRHNRSNKKRIQFQNEFVEKNPEVKPFLPGSHHLEPFKFWDKFSF